MALLALNYYAGNQTRWSLARAGGYTNVRSLPIGDVAEQIVGHEIIAQPVTRVDVIFASQPGLVVHRHRPPKSLTHRD